MEMPFVLPVKIQIVVLTAG